MISNFRLLFPLIKKYKFWYLGGLVFLGITSGLQLFIPQLLKQATDSLAYQDKFLEVIPGLSLQIVVFALLVALGRVLWRLCLQGAARRIENELRSQLFKQWVNLGRSYYSSQRVGDLMALATNDLTSIRMAISMALVAAFDGIFLTASILIILLTTQGTLALIFLIPLPLITFVILVMGRLTGPLFKSQQASYGVLSRLAQESYSGLKLIQSLVKEKYFVDRFDEASKDYQKKTITQVTVSGIMFPVVGFLSGITIVLLIIFGGIAVLNKQISPGTLVSDISYLQLLIWPMLGAGFTVNLLQRGGASMGRIQEVLATKSDIVTPKPIEADPNKGNLVIDNLNFTYPLAQSPALKNVSLALPEGSWLGITGPIGSGKSSLWQALIRLYPINESSIFVNAVDAANIEPDLLRTIFSIVPQENFLFSDTIDNNIMFGSDERDQSRLNEIIKTASFERDLEVLPQGLETEVGERGITLSGGQKQRLALARALYIDAPILVLDDCFASVDAETEHNMIEALKRERSGKTTIIISHKISALVPCDSIIVLEKGEISQRGSHASLSLEPGYYQDVYRLQGAVGSNS